LRGLPDSARAKSKQRTPATPADYELRSKVGSLKSRRIDCSFLCSFILRATTPVPASKLLAAQGLHWFDPACSARGWYDGQQSNQENQQG
jgi:hypothetical protein